MNILLVNIKSSKHSSHQVQVPLALLKLSTFYKNNGDNVEYIIAGQQPKVTPDIICFSTVFLFNIKKEIGYIRAYKQKYPNAKIRVGGTTASLRPELFREKLGEDAEIHVGLCEEIEYQKPDYALAGMDFSYGFTSRGCYKKCKWCVVPVIEGKLYSLDERWKNALGQGHTFFSAMDNNILGCDIEHIEDVLKTCKERGFKIEFNQAMDCVKFVQRPEIVDLFIKYKTTFSRIIFAWDNKSQDKFVKKTIEIMNKHKLGACLEWYTLYGWNEPPEEVYPRWRYLLSQGHRFKLMRFRDIETGKYGEFWQGIDREISRGFSFVAPHGVVGPGNNTSVLFPEKYEDFLKMVRALLLYKKGRQIKDRCIRAGDLPELQKIADRL